MGSEKERSGKGATVPPSNAMRKRNRFLDCLPSPGPVSEKPTDQLLKQ